VEILTYHDFDGIDIDWEVCSVLCCSCVVLFCCVFYSREAISLACHIILPSNCINRIVSYSNVPSHLPHQYPGYADHSGTPADKENFTRMLMAIKAGLEMLTRKTGKVYGLTAALPCNPNNIENIEVGKLTSVLTEFNLMS